MAWRYLYNPFTTKLEVYQKTGDTQAGWVPKLDSFTGKINWQPVWVTDTPPPAGDGSPIGLLLALTKE